MNLMHPGNCLLLCFLLCFLTLLNTQATVEASTDENALVFELREGGELQEWLRRIISGYLFYPVGGEMHAWGWPLIYRQDDTGYHMMDGFQIHETDSSFATMPLLVNIAICVVIAVGLPVLLERLRRMQIRPFVLMFAVLAAAAFLLFVSVQIRALSIEAFIVLGIWSCAGTMIVAGPFLGMLYLLAKFRQSAVAPD